MKKTLLSIALSFFAMGAMAQVDETFLFCNSEGETIANGSVLNVTEGEEDEFSGGVLMKSGLYVKYNGTSAGGWAGMSLDIKKMDNGRLQHCFPGNCFSYDKPGIIVRSEAGSVKKDFVQDINSEWMPAAKGMCTVAYSLRVTDRDGNMQAEGPTVTVNYCNGVEAPANVPSINAATTGGPVYNLQGQAVGQDYKGIVITNGKKQVKK